MEAGREAGRVRPGPVRGLPLLLRYDRVQRLHLRQPAHVHGGVEHKAACLGYQNLSAPTATPESFLFFVFF